MSYRILIEIGHEAAIRTKRTPEGYTHDWEIFVRGFESDMQHYVEKVVFNLHKTFDKPRRAIKEPPYKVKESGYAGFNLLIDLYLKNPEEPKKISFFYDLSLQTSGPAIYKVQKEKYVFHHPNEEFRQRLIKGGAVLTPASSSSISNHIETSRDAPDRSEDRAQLVDKPKLGGDINRKHKVRPEDPKLNNSFENLFGPPITKKSKISPEPKPVVTKSAPVVAPAKDKSVEKKKHSPHKDKAERSKSKDKEHSKKSKEERKDKGRDRDKGKEKSLKKEVKHDSPKRSPKHESPKKSPRKMSPPPPIQAPPPPPPPKKEDKHESGKERDKSADKKSKKDKRDKGKERHREHKSHSSKEEKSTEEPKENKVKEPSVPKIKETVKETPPKIKEKVPKPIEPPPPPPPREKEPDKAEKVHKSDKHEEKHKHKHKKKDKDKTKKEEKRHDKKIDKNQIEITKVPLDESSSSSKTSVQAEVEKENQKQNTNEVLIEKTVKEKQSTPKPPEIQPIDEESNDSNVSRKSKPVTKPPEPVKEPEIEKPKKSKKHKDKHKSTDEKKRKRKSSIKVDAEPEDITIVKVPKVAEEVQSEEEPQEPPQNGVKEPVEDLEEDEVEFVGPAGIMPTPFLSDDYLTRLKDLQERIMMLQDNGELQQVVQLIAETGHYEVTRHSFNFDLCTLDNATVARLQQFFTTHPGTA